LARARGFAQLPVYQLAILILEKAGNPAGAAEVARTGLQIYPRSDPLLVAQDRLNTAIAAVASAAANQPTAQSFVLLPGTAPEARRQIEEALERDTLTAARDLIRAIRAQKPAWLPAVEMFLAAREVELSYLTVDQLASRAAARTFLDRNRGEPELLELVAVAERLAGRGRSAEARLLSDEIKVAAAGNLRVQEALQRLNLPVDTPETKTQAEVLAALDAHILTQKWADAERLFKQLRERPPAWLSAASTEMRTREVQVKLGMDQRPLALVALKELVVKAGAPRSAAFKLVRDLAARGENETALLLAREISRLLPGDPAAARLLREAETPPPATP
jgi:hypothetical protein